MTCSADGLAWGVVIPPSWGLFLLFGRSLEEKFELNLPPYPGFAQIVELSGQDGDTVQKL